ncbi:MAG: hypothetical protein Q7R33_07905 [Nitrosarchaeum sp.]|nr:hypothetical protein [Nitrosarchaeum sp.]
MNQRPSEYNYIANDEDKTIRFLNPPLVNDNRHTRWSRDLDRIQYISIGYGYIQEPDTWVGKYNQEEYVSVLRFLEYFSWKRQELPK